MMASLQLPVLPRVKENPTALMLNEELQRAQQSRQCLGLGELQMGSATRKVPKTQGTCWPPTTLRLLALCCFPAHAPNVNQILTTPTTSLSLLLTPGLYIRLVSTLEMPDPLSKSLCFTEQHLPGIFQLVPRDTNLSFLSTCSELTFF